MPLTSYLHVIDHHFCSKIISASGFLHALVKSGLQRRCGGERGEKGKGERKREERGEEEGGKVREEERGEEEGGR